MEWTDVFYAKYTFICLVGMLVRLLSLPCRVLGATLMAEAVV